MRFLFKRAKKAIYSSSGIGLNIAIHCNLYSVPFLRTRKSHPDKFFSFQYQYTHLKIIQNQRKDGKLLRGKGNLF